MHRGKLHYLNSYIERVELTEDLRRKRESGPVEGLPRSQRSLFLVPVVIFSTAFFGLPVIVAIIFAMFALFILLIRQIHLKGDAIIATCPDCEGDMRKEELRSIDYCVCDRCELYAIGRDWS